MSLEFSLLNIKQFKEIINVSESLLNELKFEYDSDGIRFRGFTPSHTGYFLIEFDKDYFLDYQLEKTDNILIDSFDLNKILKRIKATDEVVVTLADDVFEIKVNNGKNNKIFKLQGIYAMYDTPSLPDIDYKVKSSIDYNDFKESVHDSDLYEDKLRLRVENDNLVIYNNGIMGNYQSIIKLDKKYDSCSSVFSMHYLMDFLKLSSVYEDMSISFGDDIPLLLELEGEGVHVKFMLAPVIEPNDDEDYN